MTTDTPPAPRNAKTKRQLELQAAEQWLSTIAPETASLIESAWQAAENLLARFGAVGGSRKIDGIFCATEPTALGSLRALQNAGYAGKVKFVGFDSSETMIAALRADELSGFVVQNPMQIGYLGVKTMVSHIRGQQVPGRIDTGSTLVTMENIEKPEIHKLLNPDLSGY